MIVIVNLTSDIITYYSDASGVPKCINMLKDDHKETQRAQLPIPGAKNRYFNPKPLPPR